MKITDLLTQAEDTLTGAEIDTARLDAEVLLAWALGTDRAELAMARSAAPTEAQRARFDEAIVRRAAGCPVAYITGVKEFWSLPIAVTPEVLIPRPDTETVVEEALRRVSDRSREIRCLDLCTGSGCIAAALAKELPKAQIVATDVSSAAIALARRNTAFAEGRIRFFEGDLFEPLRTAGENAFDLITANPPYIPDGQIPALAREISSFEPRQALAGGENGLDFVSRIIEDAPHFLTPGGWLMIEIGQGQAPDAIPMVLAREGYDTVSTARDLAGIERVLLARRSRFA